MHIRRLQQELTSLKRKVIWPAVQDPSKESNDQVDENDKDETVGNEEKIDPNQQVEQSPWEEKRQVSEMQLCIKSVEVEEGKEEVAEQVIEEEEHQHENIQEEVLAMEEKVKHTQQSEYKVPSMIPIGTVSSVFRLCVGTPRQGLLAPHARGRIRLNCAYLNPRDAVHGLEGYSHIWIVFVFHLNSNQHVRDKAINGYKAEEASIGSDNISIENGKRKKKRETGGVRLFPSKIAPPALGGKKVGLFSTRTPHRFNPIGFTLCKLDRIEVVKSTNHVDLHVSGIDLVDGTPVLDIKPYCNEYDTVSGPISVPSWVETGLGQRRNVTFTMEAKDQLEQLADRKAFEFYKTASEASMCIQEVLGVDVRSAWQTKKARRGASHAERALMSPKNLTVDTLAEDSTLEAKDSTLAAEDLTIVIKENEQDISMESDSAQVKLDPQCKEKIVTSKFDFKNFQAESTCTQQIDNMLIHFQVSEAQLESSDTEYNAAAGSGCNDSVKVTLIEEFKREEAQVDEDELRDSFSERDFGFPGFIKRTRSDPTLNESFADSDAPKKEGYINVDDSGIYKVVTENGETVISDDIVLRHVNKELLAEDKRRNPLRSDVLDAAVSQRKMLKSVRRLSGTSGGLDDPDARGTNLSTGPTDFKSVKTYWAEATQRNTPKTESSSGR